MATLGVMFGGSAFALRGGEKKTQTTPPLNAESKDEEKFIQSGPLPPHRIQPADQYREFLQQVEQEDKKAKA